MFRNQNVKDNEEIVDDVEVNDEETVADETSEAPSELEAELEKTKAQLLQVSADFENFKRAALRRETETRERAVKRTFEDLLPVFDNFDRAVQATTNAKDVETLRIGMTFIAQQLDEALKSQGITIVQSKGQMFDPNQHEAIEEIEGSEEPAGTILEEASRGYLYRDQVLRPARVKVAG